MHLLVIGGTRFIGPYVVRDLCTLGHDVTVFHRGMHESTLPAGVRSVRSPDAGMPVLRFASDLVRRDPEVVIHMIPMGQADADAAVHAFAGHAQRLVALSSGDVYLAYGRLIGSEPGPPEPVPLHEDSALRTKLYPYRDRARSSDDLSYYYEKLLVERAVMASPELPACVLRLPKVYGPGDNAELASVRAYRDHPQWRRTHMYVENVAAAIVLAATHPRAAGRTYNVGEADTPTVAERIAMLPPLPPVPAESTALNFDQDIVYDTSRIRHELGYQEPVSTDEGLRRTLHA